MNDREFMWAGPHSAQAECKLREKYRQWSEKVE